MNTTSQASSQAPARPGRIAVRVLDQGSRTPIRDATVGVWRVPENVARAKGYSTATHQPKAAEFVTADRTGGDGSVHFDDLAPGKYLLAYNHLPDTTPPVEVDVDAGCVRDACIEVDLQVKETITFERDDCTQVDCPREFDRFRSKIEFTDHRGPLGNAIELETTPGTRRDRDDKFGYGGVIRGAGEQAYPWSLSLPYRQRFPGAPQSAAPAQLAGASRFEAHERAAQPIAGSVGVTLARTATTFTADVAFWQGLVNSTDRLSFNTYLRFMDALFCSDDRTGFERETSGFRALRPARLLPFTDTDAYRVVKTATEAFVMVNCGILSGQDFNDARDRQYLARRDLPPPPNGSVRKSFNNDYLVRLLGNPATATLPYLAVIRAKLPDIALKLTPLELAPEQVSECHGILQDKLVDPCLIELIWSYWQEEGMLVQTMNSIVRRFQNVQGPGDRDPLANLEIDPLRPLNNLLWGYAQDEQHRLSIVRRNHEYEHHYGLRLQGKAVRQTRPADVRSKFIEAFHNLLRMAAAFFKQDDDTTVKADAFPVLNALKEVHLILSQGAHNQFGDLPSTARIEMLMQQWLLARPEFREFLPTRIMVAYPEPWMDRVDAMKKLQGWTDTSVLHFRNLALFGEQILLSVRWGHWSDVQDPVQAFNWLRFFRPQLQGYSHAYRAATGVDLSVDTAASAVDATLPSVLLQRRLATQQRTA